MLDHLQRRERITKRKRETLGAGRAYSTAAPPPARAASGGRRGRRPPHEVLGPPLLDQTGGEKAAPALAEPSVLLNGE